MKPYYSAGGIEVYHGDCFDVLPQLESLKVEAHLLATDPPYFRVLDAEWDNQWGPDANSFLAWLGAALESCKPLIAARGTVAVFCWPAMACAVELEVRKLFFLSESRRLEEAAESVGRRRQVLSSSLLRHI